MPTENSDAIDCELVLHDDSNSASVSLLAVQDPDCRCADSDEGLTTQSSDSTNDETTSSNVDRGWAWVVLCAILIMNGLMGKVTVRSIAVVGSALSALGACLSAFASGVGFLIFSHGCLFGLGLAMVYGPSTVLLTQYFRCYLRIATALANCAMSVGCILMAPFFTYLLQEYGRRGTMLLVGAVMSHAVLCSALLRPLHSEREKRIQGGRDSVADEKSPMVGKYTSSDRESTMVDSCILSDKEQNSVDICISSDKEAKMVDSYISNDKETIMVDSYISNDKETKMVDSCISNDKETIMVDSCTSNDKKLKMEDSYTSNDSKPTMAASYTSSEVNVCQFLYDKIADDKTNMANGVTHIRGGCQCIGSEDQIQTFLADCPRVNTDVIYSSVPLLSLTGLRHCDESNASQCSSGKSLNLFSKRSTRICRLVDGIQPKLMSVNSGRRKPDGNLARTVAGRRNQADSLPCVWQDAPSYLSTSSMHIASLESFHFASLPIIGQTNAKVSSPPRLQSSQNICERKPDVSNTKINIFLQLVKNIDLSLFRNLHFLIIFCMTTCAIVGYAMFGLFIPSLAEERGLSPFQTSTLLSVIAGLDLCSRLLAGIIAEMRWMEPRLMLAAAFLVLGVAFQFVALYTSYQHLLVFVAGFGLLGGSYASLHPIIIVDFLGVEQFAKAFGFVLVVNGASQSINYPIIGMLHDVTGTYNTCFNYLGATLLTASAALFLEPLVRKVKMRNRDTKTVKANH
ncbi:uncharacterized protein LOC121374575 isoform X2 [Gigantopelta aegis]|uniref:uncharacterized protein LOC121374575 isoform X2 n=1 Tax=Gigantopelta aegis TaxID=1735272 RepID=UPI001B88D490|nr:uncharacterized protein LOC121374575 isoform X2 [Gigantopelta aegis]